MSCMIINPAKSVNTVGDGGHGLYLCWNINPKHEPLPSERERQPAEVKPEPVKHDRLYALPVVIDDRTIWIVRHNGTKTRFDTRGEALAHMSAVHRAKLASDGRKLVRSGDASKREPQERARIKLERALTVVKAAETTIAPAAETITAPGVRKRGRPPAPMVDPTAGFKAAAKAAGGVPALARLLGVREQTPYQWGRTRIPADRIIEIERLTGVPRELLRPDLYRTKGRTVLNEAVAIIKAAGYRVSKPRTPKHAKPKDRVGPTFVAEFADGTITRMSTFTSLENLDWARGERLSQAAYQSRWRARERAQLKQTGKPYLVNPVAPVPPAIISMRFEQGDKVLAQRNGES